MARLLSPTPENIALCAAALRRGEVVAIPSETVYGLAASALNPEACRRIFQIKERPLVDPLIVHVGINAPLETYAQIPPLFPLLRKHFWPGPVSFILPKKAIIPDLITAGLPSVALRCPDHPVLQELLQRTGLPLAAPSANPFGYISPTTAAHVEENLGARIDLILDGGPCTVGLESTILDLRQSDHEITVRRPGMLDLAHLEKIAGVPVVLARPDPAHQDENAQIAPGLLSRHYSPRTKLVLVEDLAQIPPTKAPTGFLFYSTPNREIREKLQNAGHQTCILTAQGDPREAARHLYAALRQLDQAGLTCLYAEWAPPSPWSDTLNDRLRRAASQG